MQPPHFPFGSCPHKNAETLLDRIEKQNANLSKRARKSGGDSDGSKYSNSASSRSRLIEAETPARKTSASKKRSTLAQNLCSSSSPRKTTTYIQTPSSFHFFSKDIASSREHRMFLTFIDMFGVEAAIYLATTLHLEHQQPLQALLSALNESDKNCNTQSVAQEPPSS